MARHYLHLRCRKAEVRTSMHAYVAAIRRRLATRLHAATFCVAGQLGCGRGPGSSRRCRAAAAAGRRCRHHADGKTIALSAVNEPRSWSCIACWSDRRVRAEVHGIWCSAQQPVLLMVLMSRFCTVTSPSQAKGSGRDASQPPAITTVQHQLLPAVPTDEPANGGRCLRSSRTAAIISCSPNG